MKVLKILAWLMWLIVSVVGWHAVKASYSPVIVFPFLLLVFPIAFIYFYGIDKGHRKMRDIAIFFAGLWFGLFLTYSTIAVNSVFISWVALVYAVLVVGATAIIGMPTKNKLITVWVGLYSKDINFDAMAAKYLKKGHIAFETNLAVTRPGLALDYVAVYSVKKSGKEVGKIVFFQRNGYLCFSAPEVVVTLPKGSVSSVL